jgi:hypothetical protein
VLVYRISNAKRNQVLIRPSHETHQISAPNSFWNHRVTVNQSCSWLDWILPPYTCMYSPLIKNEELVAACAIIQYMWRVISSRVDRKLRIVSIHHIFIIRKMAAQENFDGVSRRGNEASPWPLTFWLSWVNIQFKLTMKMLRVVRSIVLHAFHAYLH